jgi:hypothetical protein
MAPILDKVSEEEQNCTCWTSVAPDAHDEESSEESESEESWESIKNDRTLEVQLASPPPDSANNRPYGFRGKWMREEGGRRWVIGDYQDVIEALRGL